MKNKNKIKNSLDLILKIFERILKSDKAVAISLLFCIVLTVIILYFSEKFIMDIEQALYFMFGISVLFLTLNFILNSTNNYLDIALRIQNILSKFLDAPKCKICHETMKIVVNKRSKTYIWKCNKHPKIHKSVKITCPICHSKNTLSSKHNKLIECKYCKNQFLPSDINKRIEKRFSYFIKEKLPKPKIIHIQNNLQTSLKNIMFLIIFSIIISMINYITFSNKGKELLASILHSNMNLIL